MSIDKKESLINITASFIEKWILLVPILYLAFVLFINQVFSEQASRIFHSFYDTNYIYRMMISPQISTLTTVSAVLIGFYVTTMSVFGTSTSHAASKIADGNKTDQFIRYSCTALGSAFCVLLYSIILPILPWIFAKTHLYIACFLYMIFSAIRFAAVVMVMYSDNINSNKGLLGQNSKELCDLIKRVEDLESYDNRYNDILGDLDMASTKQMAEAPPLRTEFFDK